MIPKVPPSQIIPRVYEMSVQQHEGMEACTEGFGQGWWVPSLLLCVLPESLFAPLFGYFSPALRVCSASHSSSSIVQPFLASAGRRVQELNQEKSDAQRVTPGNAGHARDQREFQKSLRSTEDMTALDSRISNNLSGKKHLSKLSGTHFKIFHADLSFLPRQTLSL